MYKSNIYRIKYASSYTRNLFLHGRKFPRHERLAVHDVGQFLAGRTNLLTEPMERKYSTMILHWTNLPEIHEVFLGLVIYHWRVGLGLF